MVQYQDLFWQGVVEDRKDPLKLGRCKVRIFGFHNENKQLLPTEGLPWSQIANLGQNVVVPKESDIVTGYFYQGDTDYPVILGVIPGIPIIKPNPQKGFADPRSDDELSSSPRVPASKTYNTDGTGITIEESDKSELHPKILDEPTTSRIARNDDESISKTFIQERKDNVVSSVPTYNSSWDEPPTQYNAVYPYNNVVETESGHLMEFDDTPGAERVQLAHRNGTFQEMYPNGDKVEKITRDNYQIIMKDDNVYIMGKCNITVQGDAEIYVQQNLYAKVDGNLEGQVGGNADVNIDGDVNVTVGGDYNEHVKGSYSVRSDGNMQFDAPRIDLN